MKQSFLNYVQLSVLISVCVSLLGCANPDLQDLYDFVETKKAEVPERIEPIPEIKQIETFLYEDQGRRDPFAAMEREITKDVHIADNGIRPDDVRRREELESYALDSLRMVGILERSGVTYGLVQSKEGTIHKVKQGNYMGQNHGKIMFISEDKIELNEIIPDGSGRYSERQATLVLTE